MTSRERLLTVLRGEIPDCVPASPDFSNMMPAKLSGMPWWDIFLYNKKPIWEAYIECAKHFDIDAFMDGHFPLRFDGEPHYNDGWDTVIVDKNDERIICRRTRVENGRRLWHEKAEVYPRNATPAGAIAEHINLPPSHNAFEPLQGVREIDYGPREFARLKKMLGDQGIMGATLTSSAVLYSESDIYDYYDNPEKWERIAQERVRDVERRFQNIMNMETKPDFLCVGGSGTLVFQTPDIFRQIALPAVKRGIELATASGFPTHVHSCGPERELVKIMTEETTLTVIDPLEPLPKGDCDLAELKRLYGKKVVLKGNLHTTDVMLNKRDVVVAASKKCIDEAAQGGRFILASADQCGRDTPCENIEAMVEVARTYGKY